MKKYIKIAIFTVMTTLLLSMSFTAFCSSGEATGTSDLNIAYCNLSFENDTHIMYAIKSDNKNVKLLVWTEPQSVYTAGSETAALSPLTYRETINGRDYTVFKYTGLSAKQMTDDVYVRAYIADSDSYGAVHKYSILQYAYNKLGKTGTATTNKNLVNMLYKMLDFGAAAQKLDDYKTDRLATDEFVQVKLTDGTLPDGFKRGLYKVGSTIKIKAPENDSQGVAFSGWSDIYGNEIESTAEYTLTVENVNKSYTPSYISYSDGLVFESEGDGTCFLVDIGDCTDKDVKIPKVSPDGDIVIGIDGAFDGADITSVSIPLTVEEIGRRTFRNCDALTDIYYEGSETEFANMSISSGNDPFENAAKHFGKIQAYKVLFADYNGKMLKGEMVKAGEAATAPAVPEREGYSFNGWSASFDNVTSDLTVTANYSMSITDPTLVISSASAAAGDTDVKITVALQNNPGIASLNLVMSYDAGLTLTNIEYNSEIGGMSQQPEEMASPVILNWFNGTADSEGDFIFATLTFSISDTATPGDYNITITYDPENVYDISETNVHFDIISGKISIQ